MGDVGDIAHDDGPDITQGHKRKPLAAGGSELA
jgi:hypothetical protein